VIYILSIPVGVGGYDINISEIFLIKRIRRYYNITIKDTRVKFFFIFLLLLRTIK
jgi:hypothetical protein